MQDQENVTWVEPHMPETWCVVCNLHWITSLSPYLMASKEHQQSLKPDLHVNDVVPDSKLANLWKLKHLLLVTTFGAQGTALKQ